MQEGMLFHALMDSESGAYFEQSDITLSGNLDTEIFEKAFNLLLERHDILRTVFLYKKVQKPRQVVLKERRGTVYVEDLSNHPNAEEYIASFSAEEKNRGFDLSRDILMKISIFKTDASSYRVLWSFHHILMDGWCMGIILSEFFQLYYALLKGQTPSLPPVFEFSTYLKWLDRKDRNTTAEFWKNYLAGFETVTSFPKLAQQKSNYAKKTTHYNVTGDLYKQFSSLCSENGITVNNAFQTLWGVLLQRYNDTKDICFGSVVSGRPAEIPNVDKILGLFINTVPTRIQTSETMTVLEAMQNVQQNNAEIGKHDYFPLADIQKNSPVNGTLFDHILVFENYAKTSTPDHVNVAEFGFKVTEMKHHEQTNYDLNVVVNPSSDALEIHIDFNANTYTEETVNRLMQRFQQLMEAFVAAPHQKIGDIHFLSKDEHQQLTQSWNKTSATFSVEDTVLRKILEVAAQHPDKIAIKFGEKSLNYAQVIERSKQFACYLRDVFNIQKGDIIAIKAERSEELIIAILGILLANATYLPMDSATPDERVSFMLKDAMVKLLVTDENIQVEVPTLQLNESYGKTYNFDLPLPDAFDSAYVIYTSGSTGQPKGCELTHENLCHYINWANDYYFDGINGNFPLYTSIAFDLTVTSIFTTLSRGATLIVYPQKQEVNEILQAIFTSGNEDIVKITPAHIGILAHLAIKKSSIKVAIVGGEQLTIEQVAILRKINPEIRIFNEYGPTEATVGCVVKEILQHPESIEIGRPIANMKAFVLNQSLQPAGIGVKGELYLSGKGIAKGYLNHPELTNERFIQLPELTSGLLYKTGDAVYWNEAGDLVYCDRLDNQLKLRGYRVEPGEIEQAIAHQLSVKEVTVLLKNDLLTAYFTAEEKIDTDQLKATLAQQLPEYMVPQFFVQLDVLPLTVNGKIDRSALPAPDRSNIAYQAPETPTEEKLAALWSEILAVSEIGRFDHFFDLGGHSLKLTILYSLIIKHFEKEISIKALFSTPVLKEQAELIDGGIVANQSLITKAPNLEVYPLSFAQKRLFILHSLEKESTAYNIPVLLQINGALDPTKIKNCFEQLIERHEIFRTSLYLENGKPVQKVADTVQLDFKYSENSNDIEDALTQFVQPFDLAHAPLFRVRMFKKAEQEYVLGIDMHHIISDGFSSGILIGEFTKLYSGQALGSLEIQYKDYAYWQQDFVSSEKYKQQKSYWINTFAPLPEPLNLPYVNQVRPEEQSFEGKSLYFEWDKNMTTQLKQYAKKQDASLFMVLMGAFKVLLYKYSGQEDIVVGTPVSGRTQPQVKQLLGMFINTLAIRSVVTPTDSFSSFLVKLKDKVLNALGNQDYPFEALVEDLKIAPDLGRNPLFDVLFIFQNVSNEQLDLSGAKISPLEVESNTSKFDLSVEISEGNETIGISLEYATALFDELFMQRFFEHYTLLIKHLLENDQQTIGKVALVSEIEAKALLSDKTGSLNYKFSNETIISKIGAKALALPNKEIIITDGEVLTYNSLMKRADVIASELVQKGISKDDTVAIRLPRGIDYVVTMLGIMKAGGAYVPVDINYPQMRQDHIISDSRAKWIITDKNDTTATHSIDFNSFDFDKKVASVNHASADGLAYIIYTSGSTGLPKGVAIEHRNTVSFIEWCTSAFPYGMYETVFAGTSFSFDLSIFELFFHLAIGKQIVLLESGMDIPKNLPNYEKVLLNTVPSVILDVLQRVDDLSNIAVINMAGEPIPNAVKSKLNFDQFKVFNLYGPSEDTTYSTFYELKNAEEKQVIGQAIQDTKAYVLDKNLQLLPHGMVGELYLSGSGIARGYLHQPELTEERFLKNPFHKGERLYKTGDLVRWNADWQLEYIGRADNQVKIRGHRIELGEIESVISQNSEIEQCTVVVKTQNNSPVICAYYSLSNDLKEDTLRQRLSEKLPNYMIPTHLVHVEQLPLTPNGKINKQQLPEPSMKQVSSEEHTHFSENGLRIKSIWQNVLNTNAIQPHDNFFQIGGHSLLATQVIFGINKQFEVSLSLRDFYKAPTIFALEELISQPGNLGDEIKKVAESDYYVISHQQRKLWISEQIQDQQGTFNMPDAYELKGKLDYDQFNKSMQVLVDRQESLRTGFKANDGEPIQFITTVNAEIPVVTVSENNYTAEIAEQGAAFVSRPFDLTQAPLWRAVLYKINNEHHVMVMCMHHIITDGWSMKIMMQELALIYQAFSEKKSPDLSPLPIQYKDYAHFQLEKSLEKDEKYWLEQLNEEVALLTLPFDNTTDNRSFSSAYEGVSINAEITMLLVEYAKTHQTSLSNVVLTVFTILLSQLTGQKLIHVGLTSANRSRHELEHLIGFFINTLVIKTDLRNNSSLNELLKQVSTTTSEAMEHQDYPFDMLIQKLIDRKITDNRKLINVAYSFQNFNDITLAKNSLSDNGALSVLPFVVNITNATSKYDLLLLVNQSNNELLLEFEYDAKRFKKESVNRFLGYLKKFLEKAVEVKKEKYNNIE